MIIGQYISRIKKNVEMVLYMLCSIAIIGIFYSKALTTGAIIGIFLLGLSFASIQKMKTFFNDKALMPFILVFLSVFLSGSYSDDLVEWQTALRVKLPFLILPLAFFFIPKLKSDILYRLHYWLIAVTVVVAGPVLVHALLHPEEMLSLISKGQPIPTPIEHVKYSMFNAYAAISALILLVEQKSISRFEKTCLALTVVFLIIFMHIIAVRTGLVILYGSLFIYGIYKLISFKKNSGPSRLSAMTFIILVAVSPFIAIQVSPTLKQKIGYMNYDWMQSRNAQSQEYSDTERIMTYKAAWQIIKSNPLIGTGYGDVRQEAHLYYDKNYNRADLFKLPHSQFLLTWAGSGLLGLIIFISGFYTPLLAIKWNSIRGLLLMSLYFNFTLSFLVENSLERSMSVAFFLIVALVLIRIKES